MLVLSCRNDVQCSDLLQEDSSDKYVVETIKEWLCNDGVDSIQIVLSEHPIVTVFEKMIYDNQFTFNKDDSDEYYIWFYDNLTSALLVWEKNHERVHAYVYETETISYINYFVIDLSEVKNKNPRLKIRTNYGDKEIYLSSEEGGWKSCFKKALKKLYDDYDEDPMGSLACGLTGPWCAIGGAIACAIDSDTMDRH